MLRLLICWEPDKHDTNLRLKVLEHKSIDAETRSRRNNIIFRSIPEILVRENCEDIINSFLRDELHIELSFCIQRAHHIGRPDARAPGHDSPKTRPIVCFRDYNENVEKIMSNASRLRYKPQYGINRDYPSEIVQAKAMHLLDSQQN